jgi:hypothetical protein
VRPESLLYGAIMGVVFVLLFSWVSGRPLRPRRPRLQNVLFAVVLGLTPLVTDALGIGFGTGVLLAFVLIAAEAVIEYAWRRLRPQRAESTEGRSA